MLFKEVIFQAIESALESATLARYEFPIKARVAIDRITGAYTTFRRWQVVEENEEFSGGIEFPTTQISLQVAQIDDPDCEVDDFVEDEIESVEFGRISAQAAKQVINLPLQSYFQEKDINQIIKVLKSAMKQIRA